MSVKESPLAQVKRLHGTKEKLVDSLVDTLGKEAGDESPEAFKQRLQSSSNKKLLRLARTLHTVATKHGSKDKLAQTVSEAKGHGKDQDYVAKLQSMPINRLLDMANAG